MTVREQVRVGGVWLYEVAPWGDLTYSTTWPLGCHEASFGAYFPATARRSILNAGQTVEIFVGSTRIWLGSLAQPDWSTGEFTADGWYTYADGPALDTSGDATSRADHAVAGAIARGIPWAGSDGVLTTPATTTAATDGLNTMTTILDAVATEAGYRWGVFADGIVRMSTDASSPTWRLAPGVVNLGYNDTTFATQLLVRYFDSGTSDYDTLTVTDTAAVALYGLREEAVDLTGFGPLTSTRATDKANGILTLGRSQLGWANSVEVGPYELTTLGGIPADLTMVRAGQSVRVPVWDDLLGLPYRDLTLGQVDYTAGSGALTIAPVDTEPQTLADVTEAIARAARKQQPAA